MQYPKFNNYLKDNYDWKAPVDPADHFSSEEEEAPAKMDGLNYSAVKGRQDVHSKVDHEESEQEEQMMDNKEEMNNKEEVDREEEMRSETRKRSGITINEEMRMHAGLANKNKIQGNVDDQEGYDEIEKKNASATAAYNNSRQGIPSLPPMAESNTNRYIITDTATRQKIKLTEREKAVINAMINLKEGKQFQAVADSGDLKKGMTYNVVTAVGNTYKLVELESGKDVTAQYGELLGVAAPFPSH